MKVQQETRPTRKAFISMILVTTALAAVGLLMTVARQSQPHSHFVTMPGCVVPGMCFPPPESGDGPLRRLTLNALRTVPALRGPRPLKPYWTGSEQKAAALQALYGSRKPVAAQMRAFLIGGYGVAPGSSVYILGPTQGGPWFMNGKLPPPDETGDVPVYFSQPYGAQVTYWPPSFAKNYAIPGVAPATTADASVGAEVLQGDASVHLAGISGPYAKLPVSPMNEVVQDRE